MASPFGRIFYARVAQKDAATATRDDAVLVSPLAGAVTDVTFVPDLPMTGADTNSATDSLVNKGSTGAGTTVAATKAWVNGQNLPAFDEGAIAVSSTAANVAVAVGDVLAFSRIKVGSGITNVPGLVKITLTATD